MFKVLVKIIYDFFFVYGRLVVLVKKKIISKCFLGYMDV